MNKVGTCQPKKSRKQIFFAHILTSSSMLEDAKPTNLTKLEGSLQKLSLNTAFAIPFNLFVIVEIILVYPLLSCG